MAGRSSRRRWQTVAVVCCLVWALGSLAGATAASHVTPSVGDRARPSLRTLQFNLCNSGTASCYTGRSVSAAAEVIRAQGPDIVTLNEMCRNDLPAIERAMSDTERGGDVVSAFEAAVDRRTYSAFRCRNGQPYGIGVLARLPSTRGYRTYGDVYPMQDPGDPEQRVWLCLHAVADFYACTTHLASTSATLAFTQCGYLLHTAIPALRSQAGHDRMVLGADLNLISGGSPDARTCLTGYRHADDGARQYVLATAPFRVRSSKSIDMHGTTDHPGLLVDLTVG
jgi:endonuclease/exonuclease/phosphatase family metal-dependent hydrolase